MKNLLQIIIREKLTNASDEQTKYQHKSVLLKKPLKPNNYEQISERCFGK